MLYIRTLYTGIVRYYVRYYVGYKNKSMAYVYEYCRERTAYNLATCIAGFKTLLECSNEFQRVINMYVSAVRSVRCKKCVPSIYHTWCTALRDVLDILIEQCEN